MEGKLGSPEGNIFVLTGAGVSAESGLPTFRGAGGLWEGEPVEEVATPEAFHRDAGRVQRFYDARRARLVEVAPNAAHFALARLEAHWRGAFLLVTQNVDDLHERAGSRRLLHMHGVLKQTRCLSCGARSPAEGPLAGSPPCPHCGAVALRPDIVWFGEMPYHMAEIEAALRLADWFVAIGTSGNVWPAAGFVELARQAGARTLEVNIAPSAASAGFDACRLGPAGREVPALIAEWLGMKEKEHG